MVEQNPLGMWQTLLNRLTRERDVAFRALKGDRPAAGVARDLAVTRSPGRCSFRSLLALELAAGLAGAVAARRGGIAGTRLGPGEPRHRDRPDRGRGPGSRGCSSRSAIAPTGGGPGGRQRLGGPRLGHLGSRIPGVEVIRLDRNVGYSRGVNLAAREAERRLARPPQRRLRLRPGLRRGDRGARSIRPPGVTMAAGVMREARDPIPDRHGGDAARPDAARLRLPERRAGDASWTEASPTRSGLRAARRRSTARRSWPWAASTRSCSRTGRTSTSCCGCDWTAAAACSRADAHGVHAALGDARVGLARARTT